MFFIIAYDFCDAGKFDTLTLKASIMTAAHDKFCNIFLYSKPIIYDIS